MSRLAATDVEKRTVAAVLADIVGNFQRIAHGEASLVLARLVERVTGASAAFLVLGSGVFLAALAVGLLLIAAIGYLSETMAIWQSVLIVAGVTAAGAGVAITMAVRSLSRATFQPAITNPSQKVSNGADLSNHREQHLPRAGSAGEQRVRARTAGQDLA